MSLYDVASLSRVPSLSTAVRNAVISLSNLSGLIAILPPSFSSIILQCPNIALCSVLKLTGTIFIGFAVLRYDKRGTGTNNTIQDSNVWGNLTANDLKQDAQKALAVLAQQPDVNSNEITVRS